MTARNVDGKQVLFRALKVKLSGNATRGCEDIEAIVDSVKDAWGDLNSELHSLPAEEQDNMKKHFNELVDDKELGEVLFGSVEEFTDKLSDLDNDEQKMFFEELFKTEIISEP